MYGINRNLSGSLFYWIMDCVSVHCVSIHIHIETSEKASKGEFWQNPRCPQWWVNILPLHHLCGPLCSDFWKPDLSAQVKLSLIYSF